MKKEQLVITSVVLLSAALISFAGYEYFWKSLELGGLVNRQAGSEATSTSQKKDNAASETATSTATSTEAVATTTPPEAKPVLTAKNIAPAILSIVSGDKTYAVRLDIKSDCQLSAAATSSATAQRTATLKGLTLNGKSVPIGAKTLTCIYPTETSEAYVPDPSLSVTKTDEAAGLVYFTLTGAENQGYGREIDWQENFVFDSVKQTITKIK